MKKENEFYVCIECGFESSKWLGRCTQCGSWNTLKRTQKEQSTKASTKLPPVTIKKIYSKSRKVERHSTGFREVDRVFGGGVVAGEVIVCGGSPGIGKTTLLLQILGNLSEDKVSCVYVSAEESQEQISLHAKRIGIKENLNVICNDNVDALINTLKEKKFKAVVIDSIQTVKTEDLRGLPGGIGQVRECASKIADFAKKTGAVVFMVSHITKGGELAGPKVLEHIVDAVFYLDGEGDGNIRLLRSIKNRFGSTRELGVFDFGMKGFSDAKNPSEMFTRSNDQRIGVCKGVVFEGNRPILAEIQALVTKTTFSAPQRVVSGVKKSKVQMLCALLSKYTRARLLERDVYINVANGLRVEDASLDLTLCVAIVSSYFDTTIDPKMVAIGEVSLTGQVYATKRIKEKVSALERLGYTEFLLPKAAKKELSSRTAANFVDSVSEIK